MSSPILGLWFRSAGFCEYLFMPSSLLINQLSNSTAQVKDEQGHSKFTGAFTGKLIDGVVEFELGLKAQVAFPLAFQGCGLVSEANLFTARAGMLHRWAQRAIHRIQGYLRVRRRICA